MNQIAILTLDNDLHGLLVQKAFANHEEIICHLVSIDRICDSLALTWSNCLEDAFRPTIVTNEGVHLRLEELQLVWWRRLNPPQIIPSDVVEPDHIGLIRNDCQTALLGLFVNEFRGKWVNDIRAARLAENKLIQLRAAEQAGFRVPRTLVSNDPATIRAFCKALDYQVVVKAVRGTVDCHLFTRMLAEEHLASAECLRLSPAIYQELIPGNLHLRVHCFGEAIHAVTIESQELDWRENLDTPFRIMPLGSDVKDKLRNCLRLLGLKMGVVDLKLSTTGSPVWLEINPQGQFLFSEGLSGLDLTTELAKFLALEASSPA
jgi:glutathione synthase/RimK-type ligase-like ATP-grasp enzyme